MDVNNVFWRCHRVDIHVFYWNISVGWIGSVRSGNHGNHGARGIIMALTIRFMRISPVSLVFLSCRCAVMIAGNMYVDVVTCKISITEMSTCWFILLGPWMCARYFLTIHPMVVFMYNVLIPSLEINYKGHFGIKSGREQEEMRGGSHGEERRMLGTKEERRRCSRAAVASRPQSKA